MICNSRQGALSVTVMHVQVLKGALSVTVMHVQVLKVVHHL